MFKLSGNFSKVQHSLVSPFYTLPFFSSLSSFSSFFPLSHFFFQKWSPNGLKSIFEISKYEKTEKFQKISIFFFQKWVHKGPKWIFYFRHFALKAKKVGQKPYEKEYEKTEKFQEIFYFSK